jgi:hypothetical protein
MRPYHPRGAAAAPAMSNINADTIRRAEEAVGRLADQYREWVRGDLEKLRNGLAAAQAGGDARTAFYKDVRHIAHDLRGQGSTFGFPLVTRIAQSMSQVIKESAPGPDTDTLLSAHFEAIARVIEDDIADPAVDAAQEVVTALETAIRRPLT